MEEESEVSKESCSVSIDIEEMSNPEDKLCIICYQAPLHARVSKCCGRILCLECINKLEKSPCPMCRSSKPRYNIPNIYIRAEIGELKTNCPYNCGEEGKVSNIESHMKICALSPESVPDRIEVLIHPHPLSKWHYSPRYQWLCDMHEARGLCLGGHSSFASNRGVSCWRCQECDYDICEKCMVEIYTKSLTWSRTRTNYRERGEINIYIQAPTSPHNALPISDTEKDPDSNPYPYPNWIFRKSKLHPHPLIKCEIDNGWECDGSHTEGGCLSGCTGFDQSYGEIRWRCVKGNHCDFDLCDLCLKQSQELLMRSSLLSRVTASCWGWLKGICKKCCS